jgi:hypothetical protein
MTFKEVLDLRKCLSASQLICYLMMTYRLHIGRDTKSDILFARPWSGPGLTNQLCMDC